MKEEEAFKKLGIKIIDFSAEIEAEKTRQKKEQEQASGQTADGPDGSEPAGSAPFESDEEQIPVPDLAQTLDEACEFHRRFTVFPRDYHSQVLALWNAHTWVFNRFEHTPYLHISSPVKRCAKTRVLKHIKPLSRAAWLVISPSPATLFRKIQTRCPTILLDELDTVFGKKGSESAEAVRAVLNAGFELGATVPRCVPPRHDVIDFSVYCPKALAGIGNPPDTIADRCLTIFLQRKLRGQKVERLYTRKLRELSKPIADKFRAWASNEEVLLALENATPTIPEDWDDRAVDICWPLLAIAEMAGGHWPETARAALGEICGTRADEDDDEKVLLLRAIHTIFEETRKTQISTFNLLEALIAREGEPWAKKWESDVANGRTKSPGSDLANMLKGFGITPVVIREGKKSTPRGYKLEQFKEKFAQYRE